MVNYNDIGIKAINTVAVYVIVMYSNSDNKLVITNCNFNRKMMRVSVIATRTVGDIRSFGLGTVRRARRRRVSGFPVHLPC